MLMLTYCLGAAYAAALTLAIAYNSSDKPGAALTPGFIVMVVLGSLGWIVMVPLAVWGILLDASRSTPPVVAPESAEE